MTQKKWYRQKRPTKGELIKKLESASRALQKNEGLFANPVKMIWELEELKIGESKEIWPLILTLLSEISPDNYVGGYPPQESYEERIEGIDLFSFAWESKTFSQRMYLKFTLKKGRFYLVSLHKSRPKTN